MAVLLVVLTVIDLSTWRTVPWMSYTVGSQMAESLPHDSLQLLVLYCYPVWLYIEGNKYFSNFSYYNFKRWMSLMSSYFVYGYST